MRLQITLHVVPEPAAPVDLHAESDGERPVRWWSAEFNLRNALATIALIAGAVAAYGGFQARLARLELKQAADHEAIAQIHAEAAQLRTDTVPRATYEHDTAQLDLMLTLLVPGTGAAPHLLYPVPSILREVH
jgi:hypothetical protein